MSIVSRFVRQSPEFRLNIATFLGCLFVLIALLRAQTSTPEPAAPTTPYKIEQFNSENPRWRGIVARIDLADPRLRISVSAGGPDPDGDGAWETVLQPTSTIAKANQLDLAINTVFFSHKSDLKGAKPIYRVGDWASSCGWVVNEGKLLSQHREGTALTFDQHNTADIGTLNNILPQTIRTAVAGNRQIVFRGKIVEDPSPERAPRTAVGIADKGKTLVLFVIDGRREGWSIGMNMNELAKTMLDLGCQSALNLDGGGSSTLVARQDDEYKVLNTPSDGSTFPIPLSIERPVPFVLGFRWTDPKEK